MTHRWAQWSELCTTSNEVKIYYLCSQKALFNLYPIKQSQMTMCNQLSTRHSQNSTVFPKIAFVVQMHRKQSLKATQVNKIYLLATFQSSPMLVFDIVHCLFIVQSLSLLFIRITYNFFFLSSAKKIRHCYS